MNVGFAPVTLRSTVFTTSNEQLAFWKPNRDDLLAFSFFNMIENVYFAGRLVLVNSGLLLTPCDFMHVATRSDQSECRWMLYFQPTRWEAQTNYELVMFPALAVGCLRWLQLVIGLLKCCWLAYSSVWTSCESAYQKTSHSLSQPMR